MSDRGRSRRTARSTKATPAKAVAPEQATPEETPADADAVEEVSSAGASTDKADEAGKAGKTDKTDKPEPVGDKADGDEAGADKADEPDAADEPDDTADPADEPEDKGDNGDKDADEDADEDAADEPKGKAVRKAKPDARKGKSGPPPLTKADKRAAARKAAARVAKRRKALQIFAGTLIVVLAVGGAFAGVYYFGEKAEREKTMCKPQAQTTYPPLLGGFDSRLATEPTVEKGTGDVKNLEKKILIEGPCKTVKPGQTITVNYVGVTYADGQVFDSSWKSKRTFDTAVGMKQSGQQLEVIPGWDEGLVGVKVGSRVQLDIPAKDAYGENPPQGAPAGTLRFVVDVLDAKDSADPGLGGLGG